MLTSDFLLLCKNFIAKQKNVVDAWVEDTKKQCRYTVEFLSHYVEFRYVKKDTQFIKARSLYCVIGLRKNSVVYYHLPDIIPYLEQKSFTACYFSRIENAERLTCCFESLVKQLALVTAQIEPFLFDDTVLSVALFENYTRMFGLKENDIDFTQIDDEEAYDHTFFLSMQNFRDGFLFSRFSNFAPYALLVKKQPEKAILKYEQIDRKHPLFAYEKQLLAHIKDPQNAAFEVFEPGCNSLPLAEAFSTPLAFVKAFLAVFVTASVVFCGAFAGCNAILASGTRVLLSAPWYAGFLCALFCSIFGTIALFPYMPNRHLSKQQRKDLSDTLVHKPVKAFALVAFGVSVAASVFFAVMMLCYPVRFYEDRLTFESKTYSYEQIECVYHIDARYNEWDERLNLDSYVILFKDQTSFDLYGNTSVAYTEQEILPLLREKQIAIKQADSEKELPWYTEG